MRSIRRVSDFVFWDSGKKDAIFNKFIHDLAKSLWFRKFFITEVIFSRNTAPFPAISSLSSFPSGIFLEIRSVCRITHSSTDLRRCGFSSSAFDKIAINIPVGAPVALLLSRSARASCIVASQGMRIEASVDVALSPLPSHPATFQIVSSGESFVQPVLWGSGRRRSSMMSPGTNVERRFLGGVDELTSIAVDVA